MYKLKCLQGTDTKTKRIYKTKNEVYEDLKSYHDQDLQNGTVYELNDLLEIGEWELIEIK